MDVNVEPKQKRTVSFNVDEQEARQIAGWLRDALKSNPNTPYSSKGVYEVMGAFQQVAENGR